MLERYSRYGIGPTTADFVRYPRPPPSCSTDGLGMGDEAEEGLSDDQLHQAVSSSASPVSFVLESSSAGHVATIRLARDVLRMGEELTCAVSFTAQGRPSTVEVFQVLAEITCTEVLAPSPSDIPSSSSPPAESSASPTPRQRHVVGRHEEMCWLHRSVSFSLSLPTGPTMYPPSMSTDVGTVEWAFEMILVCAPHPHDSPQLTVTPVGPDKNIIHCRLPLKVVPSLAACSPR